jgi:hypothetical protein
MPSASSAAVAPPPPPAAAPATLANPQIANAGKKGSSGQGSAAGAYASTIGTTPTGLSIAPSTSKTFGE